MTVDRHPVGTDVCRFCGSARVTEMGRFSNPAMPVKISREAQSPGRLLYCPECSVGFKDPILPRQMLEQQYQSPADDSYEYMDARPWAWRAAVGIVKEKWGAAEHPRILDVGCHRGRFFDGFPEGWMKFGIEPAHRMRRALEERGITVIAERVEEVKPEWEGYFDVVTLFDVIEHCVNPMEALQSAARYVRPGGLLIVGTGNMSAWTWSLWKADHWYADSDQHISFVTTDFFRKAQSRLDSCLMALRKGPHQTGSIRDRVWEGIGALYYAFRLRGGFWRLPQVIIQNLGPWKALRHKNQVPYLMHLHDHLLAVFCCHDAGRALSGIEARP